MEMQSIDVKTERFYFSVRLRSLFFPMDLTDITPLLQEIGYSIYRELIERLPEAPAGGRLVIGGNIAQRADVGRRFSMNPDRGVVTITGHDIDGVVDDFTRFEKLVKERLNLDFEDNARFYEINFDGTATTGKDPTKVVAKVYQSSTLLSDISKSLELPVANFGIRVVEKNRYTTEDKWLEIKIEPSIPRPNSSYYINFIYREAIKTDVLNQSKVLIETIKKLITSMEQEA
ncbi:hypothetical protein ES703_90190 [subsurface metagenome]